MAIHVVITKPCFDGILSRTKIGSKEISWTLSRHSRSWTENTHQDREPSFPGKVCCWANLCLFGQLIILWKCLKYTAKCSRFSMNGFKIWHSEIPLWDGCGGSTNPPTELRSNYCIPQLSNTIMAHMLTLPEIPGPSFSSLNSSGCIFSKPRAFGESSSESEGSDVGVPESRVEKNVSPGQPWVH